MDIITTAVYVGIALAIVMFLFNIFHYIIAAIFGVRIEIFCMSYPLVTLYMFQFYRNETSYRLGWIPLGGFVKHSGVIAEGLDESKVIPSHMLLSKTPLVKFICISGTPILLLIPFVISAFFIDTNNSITVGFQVVYDVFHNLYEYLFTLIDSDQATANWYTITQKHTMFPIVFCFISLLTAITSTLSSFKYLLQQGESMLDKVFEIIQGILLLYFAYKGIALYFSVDGFMDGLWNLFKFTIAVYIISFVLMLLIKLLPKNKYI